MKKCKVFINGLIILVVMAVLLAGCTKEETEQLESEADIETEAIIETDTEQYSYFPIRDRIDEIHIGSDYEDENYTVFVLNEKERVILWQLIRVDEWVVAEDLPAAGFDHDFSISEGNEQSWFFCNWYGRQVLIIPSFPNPEDGEKVCFFAPLDVLTDTVAFIDTLTPQ